MPLIFICNLLPLSSHLLSLSLSLQSVAATAAAAAAPPLAAASLLLLPPLAAAPPLLPYIQTLNWFHFQEVKSRVALPTTLLLPPPLAAASLRLLLPPPRCRSQPRTSIAEAIL
uniref:Secreted protein n=1 Tax=Oryza rufipogon TaxID=4529 RepID=A0A0E0QWP7_ORYRU